jgi:hypothetical protein
MANACEICRRVRPAPDGQREYGNGGEDVVSGAKEGQGPESPSMIDANVKLLEPDRTFYFL